MYDPFLIARLDDREWRLLGTLLLTRQQSSVFKRRELMERSGLNKNNLNLARAGLIKKGLIAVRALGGDGNEYTIIQGTEFWEMSEVQATIKEPDKVKALPKPKDDGLSVLIGAYKDLFPVDEKYPLTEKKAAEMLALGEGDVQHVLSVFNRVAINPDVKAPKAYIISILSKEKPQQVRGAEVIDPVYYALMNRRKQHGTHA